MIGASLLAVAQAPQGMSGVAFAADLAQVVIAVAILVVSVLAAVLFWRTSALLRQLQQAAQSSLAPVSDRAGRISDNVEFITQSLRTDVESLNASVRALSERLQQASDRMEERIEEFNALMEVVQGEAEEMFLDTASTVRGVREGARAIGERARSRPGAERGDESAERVEPVAPAPGALPEGTDEVDAPRPALDGDDEPGDSERGAGEEHATRVGEG